MAARRDAMESVLVQNPKEEAEQARAPQRHSAESAYVHSSAPPHAVYAFLATLGNRSTQRVLAPLIIQPKLTIGAPDDIYEKEADAVAEQVMAAHAPQAAGAAAPDDDQDSRSILTTEPTGQTLARQAMLGRIPIRTLQETLGNRALARLLAQGSPAPAVPELRRKCACGGDGEEECPECRVSRLAVQRNSASADVGMEAPPIVESVLATPGQPLADSARKTLEPGFGHDFSDVRVHDDSQAAASASAVSALAYTVGNHIVFGAGQYAPGTNDGNRLLAHELTHTIQQTGGTPSTNINRARSPEQVDSSVQRENKRALQRVHLDSTGRKVFDCPDFAGDQKLEACLNDEDRLSPGEHSPTVAKVQNGLLRDGADLGKDGADGKYGSATGQAVMAFKRKYNLGFEQYPDVGPGTMAKLDELCKPGPQPPPVPPTPKPKPPGQGGCFDTIDWPSVFEQFDNQCRINQSSIDAICALAPNSPFNVGPDVCPKTPFEERVEDCVADEGFTTLAETCGIALQGPGKSEIRKMYKDWLKTKP